MKDLGWRKEDKKKTLLLEFTNVNHITRVGNDNTKRQYDKAPVVQTDIDERG